MKKYFDFICSLFFLIFALQLLNPMSSKDNKIVEDRIKKINQVIPKDHPRVLILKSELEEFKDFVFKIKKNKDYSYVFKNAILYKFNIPLINEPKRIPKEKTAERVELWRKAYKDSFNTGIIAQMYAFSYLITKDNKFAREAARWLMHLASWDINGGIDIKNNDEAFIQSLRPMILAYDWVYNALTEKEKKYIESALKERVEILFEHVTNLYLAKEPIPIEKNSSHKMRFISTIGLAGLALYHELRDAPKYLAWAYEYYNRQFPSWGGKDGGYSEGLNYWQTGHNQHFMFLDAMSVLNLNEIFERDYFKNNGYFAVYNILPYRFTSFGDLCNSLIPDENTAMQIEKYAFIYKDPYLINFHGIIFDKYPSGLSYYNYSFFDSIFQLYRKGDIKIDKKDFKDLPRSRCFHDIGWVAFHSELGSKDNDIMLGFKSSPYGSASHSFADQNSFVINAFGEELAISSGYREWYASPHHYGFTKMTISKNAVLINNNGQMINNANAAGRIIHFYTGKNFDFTTGDAKKAYDPVIGVIRSLRSIFFINKKYFIIFDEIKNKKSAEHQWLLHANEKIIEQPKKNQVEIETKNANLLVRFVVPNQEELKFSQTDQFIVPVNFKYKSKLKNEWHFTADAYQKEKSREFITLLYPYKKETKDMPIINKENSKKGYLLNCNLGEVNDIIFLSKDNENIVESNNKLFKGKAGVVSKNKDLINFVIIEGSELKTLDVNINSSNNISGEGEIIKDKLILNIQTKKEVKVQIKINFIPKKVEGISKENFNYDDFSSTAYFIIDKDVTIKLSQ